MNKRKISSLNNNDFDRVIFDAFWDTGSFNGIHQEIHIDNTSFKRFEQEKEESLAFPTVIHEFIHYFQQMTTIYGISRMLEFIKFYSFLFPALSLGFTSKGFPLKQIEEDEEFKFKNFTNYRKHINLGIENYKDNKYIYIKTNLPDYQLIHEEIYDPFSNNMRFISYITYQTQKIPLNGKVIKENMAIIASYLSADLPEENIIEAITDRSPQYHIIYSYLFFLFPQNKCTEITYKVCELSLMLVQSEHMIYEILVYLKNNDDNLKNLSEKQIIDQVLNEVSINKSIPDEVLLRVRESGKNPIEFFSIANRIDTIIISMLDIINSNIKLYTTHSYNNEFFGFIIEILKIYHNGISLRRKKLFSYEYKYNIKFLLFYTSIIASPIYIFNNEAPRIIGYTEDKKYLQVIANYCGILKVFSDVYDRIPTKCPLLPIPSLCPLERHEFCEKSYFRINELVEYQGCIANNAFRVIGIIRDK